MKKEGEEATEATTLLSQNFETTPRPKKKKQLTFLKHKLTARGHVRAIPFLERFCAPSQHFFKKKVTEVSISVYLSSRPPILGASSVVAVFIFNCRGLQKRRHARLTKEPSHRETRGA